MNPFFVEQMAMYSAYHRDWRNRATHFIGIPAIAFALTVPLAWVGLFELGGMSVTLATLLWAATAVFYLWLDRALGVAMAIVFFAIVQLGAWVAAQGPATGWWVFALGFVGGWVFQLVGHVFEGRRPALLDNLLQALIGPLFLMAEVFFALGFKRAAQDAVEARWRNYSVGARLAAKAEARG